MTPEELKDLVSRGESETLEFKRSTSQAVQAAQTLCGMLNQRGGRVLFGVDDRGHVTGQPVGAGTLERIEAEIAAIDPLPLVTIDTVPIASGKEVITLAVHHGSQRPYTYKGHAYLRAGTTTRRLSRQQYHQLLVEELHGTIRWENEVADGWTVADLDQTEIVRTLEEAIRRGRAPDPGTREPASILRGFGLMRDQRIVRAAVVLFAKRERLLPDYPQCLLRLARFRGTDRTEFLDNRQFQGHAFDLLLLAERFLRENLPVAGRIVPNLFERQDDPLYPTEALREALANAICHRDYTIGGGSVAVAIYDDRLEVTSSGTLHFGLTVEDLFRPHESLPWNPLIARSFYQRGIIDTWGRGTLKMVELLTQAGLPRPEFEATAGAVVVRFRPTRYIAPQRIGHDLTERQQSLLRILGSGSRLPLRQIISLLPEPIPESTVRDDLNFLRQLGLVQSAGRGRAAYWSLYTKQESTLQ